MKKIFLITLVAICTLISGCSNINHSKASDEPVKLEASEYADLSQELLSYEIKLDGVKYTLPANYTEFESNGWKLSDDDSEKTLLVGFYILNSIKLTKGDKEIDVAVINNGTGASTKLTDCQIGGVSIYERDKTSIILPKGITIGSSIDDLKDFYGEPKEITSYDSSNLKDCKIYKYEDNDELSYCWIGVDTKTNRVTDIDVTRLVY